MSTQTTRNLAARPAHAVSTRATSSLAIASRARFVPGMATTKAVACPSWYSITTKGDDVAGLIGHPLTARRPKETPQ